MSFKSEESEFTFCEVIKLFKDFNQVHCRHVQSIINPEGGECFWVIKTPLYI